MAHSNVPKHQRAGSLRRAGLRAGLLVLWLCVLIGASGTAAQAQDVQEPAKEAPALLQADEVVFDDKANIVKARGNVEISRGERILLTDSVSYDLDADVIRAEGNVNLLEPSGEVVFADKVTLKGDLREGAVQSFRMLMTDRSRLAAANAVRVEGQRTILRKVVFSPCRLCKTDPERPPLWQIKADKVVHDQKAKVLVYRNAWLEFHGVPIIYTPYFEHPDPTVDRKTGFLTPSFRISEELGTWVQTPFYYAISPQRDLTVEPIVTSEQGLALKSEYRARTEGGQYRLGGSGTFADRATGGGTKRDVFRGHIDSEGQFNINRTFRWGFDANLATDDTYKRLYDFGDDRFLQSQLYVEGFRGGSYMSARALGFQGQTVGDPDGELPIVLPQIQYEQYNGPEALGGRTYLNAGFLGITRRDGRDSRRLSSTLGWSRQVRDGLGGEIDFDLALHGDGYATQGVDPGNPAVDPSTPGSNDLTGRLFPQAAASYALPMARQSFLGREVIEPKVQVVAGPSFGNDETIPNEDSRDFNLEDTNLFKLNRFPGRDRVSTGQRLDYGLSYSIYGQRGTTLSTFLGQSYRLNGDDEIPESAGGEQGLSDIVGRVAFHPLPTVDALYRFRFDDKDLKARQNELALGLGPRKLRLDMDYTFLDEANGANSFSGTREEIYGRLSSRFARYWSGFISHRRDVANGEPLESMVGIAYHDECFLLDIQAKRTFFNDREVDPERSIMFRFALKHLGVFAGQ